MLLWLQPQPSDELLGCFYSPGADEVVAEDSLVTQNAHSRVLLGVEKFLKCLVTMSLTFCGMNFCQKPEDVVASSFMLNKFENYIITEQLNNILEKNALKFYNYEINDQIQSNK